MNADKTEVAMARELEHGPCEDGQVALGGSIF